MAARSVGEAGYWIGGGTRTGNTTLDQDRDGSEAAGTSSPGNGSRVRLLATLIGAVTEGVMLSSATQTTFAATLGAAWAAEAGAAHPGSSCGPTPCRTSQACECAGTGAPFMVMCV